MFLKKTKIISIVAFAVAIFSIAGCSKDPALYKVVRVSDGDTIAVLSSQNEQILVRMYGIDAPEKNQPFGMRAKEELSDLVFGKYVRIDIALKNKDGSTKRDPYGRLVGRIYVGDTFVNEEMVSRGFAWWYKDYGKENREFEHIERNAKAAKRGLWSEKAPTAPWEYRANEENLRRERKKKGEATKKESDKKEKAKKKKISSMPSARSGGFLFYFYFFDGKVEKDQKPSQTYDSYTGRMAQRICETERRVDA